MARLSSPLQESESEGFCLAPTEKMIMQVKHDLAGTGAVIDLDAEVLSPIAEQFADLLHCIRKQGANFGWRTHEIGEVLFRTDQQMNRRFGGDVVEHDDIVILVEDFRGDGSFNDLAEDAVHGGK